MLTIPSHLPPTAPPAHFPDSMASTDPAAHSRVTRHLVEPVYTPSQQSWREFQQEHYEWRGGAGPAPENEGVLPSKPWYQQVGEAILGLIFGGPAAPEEGIGILERPTIEGIAPPHPDPTPVEPAPPPQDAAGPPASPSAGAAVDEDGLPPMPSPSTPPIPEELEVGLEPAPSTSGQAAAPNRPYFDQNLTFRLDHEDASVAQRMAYISDPNHFIHDIAMEDPNDITSMSYSGSDDKLNELDSDDTMSTSSDANYAYFNIVYRPEQWTVKATYRSKDNLYFANDIIRYQYRTVATKNNFFGKLPSQIKIENIANATTSGKMAQVESGTDHAMNIFLKETPNGKSLQRTLDDFGLKATKVRVEYDERGLMDIRVDVTPLPSE